MTEGPVKIIVCYVIYHPPTHPW